MREAEPPEVLRTRARRRLIGAGVLVVAAVVALPLVFESQPRPLDPAIAISLPGHEPAVSVADGSAGAAPKAGGNPAATPAWRPLVVPPPSNGIAASAPGEAATAAVALPPATRTASAVATQPAAAITSPITSPTTPITPGATATTVPSTAAAAAAKAASAVTSDAAAQAKAAQARAEQERVARAEALAKAKERAAREQAAIDKAARDKERAAATAANKVQAQAPSKADAGTRFVVQVGAFAEAAMAREARARIEKIGLHANEQNVDTVNGRRIRVRLGPFDTRAEADKALARLQAAGLPGAVLGL
ncbi:MAG: SPOR domain-containing protein [Leptothrix sp. (in: b-proteobacteria)]